MDNNKKIELTKEEREVIYFSLSIRCGYIETGTIYRSKDLINAKSNLDKIKSLSKEQMELINLMEKLMIKMLD